MKILRIQLNFGSVKVIILMMMLKYHWKILRFTHRDGNINVKLNHKIPVVFDNLKNYDSYSKNMNLFLRFGTNWKQKR